QGLARALRDPHPQAADRHPPADTQDGRLAAAARPPACRRGHRDPPGHLTATANSQSCLMSAILAKKLGSSQLFLEDGSVARVTVLQAGPCPVTAIRTPERDGYDAVQLAFGEARQKSLTRDQRGHLAKVGAPPMHHLAEFRGEAGEL